MPTVIDNPILNSAFREPSRHFRFDAEGITNDIVGRRRTSVYFIPIAQPRKKGKQLQFETEWTEDRLEENRIVNLIRQPRGCLASGRSCRRHRNNGTFAGVLDQPRSGATAVLLSGRGRRDSDLHRGGGTEVWRRVDDDLSLIIEVTGESRKDKAEKVSTARTLWIPAVNNHGGFGRWAFVEITDPRDAQRTIHATVTSLLRAV